MWFVDTNLTWGEIMVNPLGIDQFFDEQKDIPVIKENWFKTHMVAIMFHRLDLIFDRSSFI